MDYKLLTKKQEKLASILREHPEKEEVLRDLFRLDLVYLHHILVHDSLEKDQVEELLTNRPSDLSLLSHDEQGLIYTARALAWIYRRAADHTRPEVNEDDLSTIHAYICGHSDDAVCKVEYRSQNISNNTNTYDGPADEVAAYSGDCRVLTPDDHYLVPQKVAEFITWLTEERELHPVQIAARAHYKLLAIHPFDSQNSATSLLLSHLLLLLRRYPAAIFTPEQRADYVQSIERARVGNFSMGEEFFYNGVDRALDLCLKVVS